MAAEFCGDTSLIVTCFRLRQGWYEMAHSIENQIQYKTRRIECGIHHICFHFIFFISWTKGKRWNVVTTLKISELWVITKNHEWKIIPYWKPDEKVTLEFKSKISIKATKFCCSISEQRKRIHENNLKKFYAFKVLLVKSFFQQSFEVVNPIGSTH